MRQTKLPAVFMRGGTSKGLFFHERDLPEDVASRERFLLSAFGSPDPYGRQLNGMGGGISSLSKAIIVRPSGRSDADLDFLHGQVAIDRPMVDWSANCGNLSSAVGPFALDTALIKPNAATETVVRLHNLNTGALIHARTPLVDGIFSPEGRFAMPGVSGTGARIALEYLHPGAPGSGHLFPGGSVTNRVTLPEGIFTVTASYATLPVAWVRAEEVGLDATLPPDKIDADGRAMALLEAIRREAAVWMGLAATPEQAKLASPKVGIVARPRDYQALDGSLIRSGDADILVRMISMARAHKAVPLTGAMCLAATRLVPNSIPFEACERPTAGPEVRIATPSGVVTVGAMLVPDSNPPVVDRTIVYTTARRLMEGWVYGTS